MSRLAFILSQFPEMHETFILREFVELRRQEIDFSIYSLRSCHDPIIHGEVDLLTSRVHYSPYLLSWQLLKSNLAWQTGRPRRYFGALWALLRRHWSEPLVLFKLLAVFPKTVRFAFDMESEGVEHLHAHWATVPTSIAMVISRLTGIRYSFTAHAWDIYVDNPTLPEKVQRASFVMTCTAHNKQHLESLRGSNTGTEVLLNYHGIDLERFSPSPAAPNSVQGILAVGRLVEQKGYPWLLRALRLVHDRGYEIPCRILGRGPEEGRLRNLVRELRIEDFVHFLEPVSQEEIRDLYRRSRMFVLPCVVASNNDRDGIPNVLVEAMAMGLPVLTTRVSGIPELVDHEHTGLLADPRDAAAIAEGIIRLLEDDQLWHHLRSRGRQRVEQMFDVDRNVAQLVGYFTQYGAIS